MTDTHINDQSMRQADKLRRALSKRDLKVITPEAILVAFEEEGFRSLEDYAKKLSEVIQEGKGFPQRIDVDSFARRRTPDTFVASIKHPMPKVSFVMGGVVHDPKDILRFDGQALLYIDSKNELLVFTEPNVGYTVLVTLAMSGVIQSALQHAGGLPYSISPLNTPSGEIHFPPHPGPHKFSNDQPPPAPNCLMFDDMNWSGNQLELEAGYSFSDLSECYTWPFGSGWNDCISSIWPSTDTCMFFEHVNFQGSQLLSFGSSFLDQIAWNDRISSAVCIKTVITHTP